MANSTDSIRVVIADGHEHVRQEVRRLLSLQRGFYVIGEACTVSAAIPLACRLKPDVLLLGLNGIPEDGLLGVNLNTLLPAPTLALMTYLGTVEVLKAFRLGVRGIILKKPSRRALVESIQSVAAGDYWFDKESVRILVETLRELLPNHDDNCAVSTDYGLTPREVHIVTKIADGRSNKEIGHEFSISERTVKHHLTSIFLKLGVSSRLELAMFAVDHDFRNNHSPAVTKRVLQPI